MKDYCYIPGDPYVLCDICGFKYRASQMQREWDKAIVCCNCFNDYPWRIPKPYPNELKSIRIANPEPEDVFIDPTALPDNNDL